MKRRMSALILSLCMLIPLFAVLTQAEGVYQPDTRVIFKEDHVNKTLSDLTAGNKTVTHDGKAPLDNLYDQKIVGEEYTDFSNQFAVVSKKLSIQGNHAAETCSKNTFSISNDGTPNAGKGFITVVPSSVTAGLDQFTVSYVERQYKPNGVFGLALFYNNTVEADGEKYFGGYDNYSFTGFTGTELQNYAAYTLSGGAKTEAACAAMTTKPTKNASVYVSVTCTKGAFAVDGKTWTAKIESYVDDYLIATSYGMWADAPVMFYYETPADSRYDVQFTNISVTTRNAHLDPAPVTTAVAYKGCQETQVEGGSYGVRFIATVDSLDYSAVGYRITASYTEGGETKTKTYGKALTSVCTSLLAKADDDTTVLVNAEALGGAYLMAYSIRSIPASLGEITFTVTPWYERDGVKTDGTSYTVVYRAGTLISQSAVPAV